MKVLAVGDIHTKLWIIDAVKKIADNYDRVVFVGDYADDWDSEPLDTIRTWEALYSLKQSDPEKYHFVVGNHDYIYVHKTPTISSGYSAGTQFMLNLPENRHLKNWIETIPLAFEIDDVIYSHAGFTQTWYKKAEWNKDMTAYEVSGLWQDDSPLWVRPDTDNEDLYIPRRQVFGHTPSETCWEVQPHNWCIDTFSTYPDGTPVGDGTVLEIEWGRVFTKIKLETKDGNDNTIGIKT